MDILFVCKFLKVNSMNKNVEGGSRSDQFSNYKFDLRRRIFIHL